ncbi:MAG: YIP1 family protein [Myxococcales bacterium]|jgi:hypothetical protein
MLCPHCHSAVEEAFLSFCPSCGGILESTPVEPARAPRFAESEAPHADLDSPLADFERPSAGSVAAAAPLAGFDAPRCAVHPDRPTRQVCSRCGAFACGDCLRISRTGAAICVACVERTNDGAVPVPWEDRDRAGLVSAFLQTTAAILLSPGKTFREMPPTTGRWWGPLSFALVSLAIPFLVAVVFFFVGADDVLGRASQVASRRPDLPVAALAILMALGFASYLAIIFVLAGVEHLCLKLVGVQTRGYEATLRGHCYSYAPAFVTVFPIVGGMAFFVWQLICRGFAYRGLHDATGGQAALAVLLPWGLCCAGNVLLFLLLSAL